MPDCGCDFGGEETTSCCLGKNQILGTLTDKGYKVVRFLERLERNHCIKSVHEPEFEERKQEFLKSL